MRKSQKSRLGVLVTVCVLIIPTVAIAGSVLVPPATVTGTSTTPVFSATNNGTGSAIQAQSRGGSGLVAITSSASAPAMSATNTNTMGGSAIIARSFGTAIQGTSKGFAGVVGSTSNTKSAVSTAGVVGIDFQSTVASNAGVMGKSTNGAGISGTSANGVGVLAMSGVGTAVVANASNGFAGVDANGHAFGVRGFGDTGVLAIEGGPGGHALQADATAGGDVFIGYGSAGVVTSIDNPGNLDIAGQYRKRGSCVAGCAAPTKTSVGRAVVSYVPTQTVPTIDDFGEATLQNGFAYVPIDPAFSNVIDRSGNYIVFITPEGNSRGLYVLQKSAQGFAVRENMGGHSSLAFSYRILAHPIGSHERRLPTVLLPRFNPKPTPNRK